MFDRRLDAVWSLYWAAAVSLLCLCSCILALQGNACFDRSAILERCLRRLEFDKARDAEAKAQADQLEAERMAMQSIDR